jgi:hypothetical protein
LMIIKKLVDHYIEYWIAYTLKFVEYLSSIGPDDNLIIQPRIKKFLALCEQLQSWSLYWAINLYPFYAILLTY